MSGQAFRWRNAGDTWSCAVTMSDGQARRPYLLNVSAKADLVHIDSDPQSDLAAGAYFRTDIDLGDLNRAFRSQDPALGAAIDAFPGLRVLRQDPVECLFSFLCTSAAPLHRIRTGIDRFCNAYGETLSADGQTHRLFPTVDALADADVDRLFGMGLGFRARYIKAAAGEVRERGGEDWLLALREASYADAKRELVALTGVGEKIADCVLLFSLDKDDAVPVDTHIRQVAARFPEVADPKAPYARIAGAIRDRYGPYAGWAQQYLFFGNLYERGAWAAYARQYT